MFKAVLKLKILMILRSNIYDEKYLYVNLNIVNKKNQFIKLNWANKKLSKEYKSYLNRIF